MSILSGWIKTRRRKKTEDGYKAVSYDTSAETVYYNNGLTLEESNVYLTQAEYDALGDEKLSNNVTYHITDSGVGKDVSAKYINYDNTNSELSSENVQNALDEISTNVATNTSDIETNKESITELNNALSNIKVTILYNDGKVAGVVGNTCTLAEDVSNYDFLFFENEFGAYSIMRGSVGNLSFAYHAYVTLWEDFCGVTINGTELMITDVSRAVNGSYECGTDNRGFNVIFGIKIGLV